MEFDNVSGATKHPVTPLKAQCQADALEEGKKLWQERLKNCDDELGAKRIDGSSNYFWPSKPRIKLEISLPVDPL